jgi:hypothetical protein
LKDKAWIGPATGILFLVVVIISFVVSGKEPPDVDSDTQKIVDFYVDNDSSLMIGAALQGLAITLLIFFGGFLRKVLRSAEGPDGWLSLVSFGGLLVLSAGLAFDATLVFMLADQADKVDPSFVQGGLALFNDDFIPMAVGAQVFLWSTGISILRHGALPKWIGWVMVVLGVVALTPAGFAAFIGMALLVPIMSVILTRRERSAATA